MGVHTFPKGICPKVNVIARLEFELAYYDSAVHCSPSEREKEWVRKREREREAEKSSVVHRPGEGQTCDLSLSLLRRALKPTRHWPLLWINCCLFKISNLYIWSILITYSFILSRIIMCHKPSRRWASQLGQQNISTVSMQSVKTPPMSFLFLTLNNLMWRVL